jgi:lipooligosaccharide transport system ATP-binding protein
MPQDAMAIKAQLGVVSQFDTLDPDFHLRRKPAGVRPLLRLADAQIRERIPQLLEFAALTHKAKAKPGELSGGMKRRLSPGPCAGQRSRACCCWTNPPPAWTRRPAT